jgi:hypothetical protein
LANIGKLVELVTVVVFLVHKVKSLDLAIRFVRASSISKPLGASVTGSWSKRKVSAGAVSIRPAEVMYVPMDALVNVRSPLLMMLKGFM